ncbi:MAG: hypothetical protein OSB25_08950 [Salibacteraceae bacterium]|nr:hypothetical protein [Salibacteraceae bacterium]|tara:strand:+ start:19634 stop:20398 length:765 start_codon:yes stop_codon:yes gene_type:complete
MKYFIQLLLITVLFSSCSSIETASYYTDDLYYNNDVTHNFNTSAILNNENVAMPEGAVVYYDKEESSRINPSFEDRIAAYEAEDENSTYEPNDRTWMQPQSPYISGAAGLMVSGGGYLISPYQTHTSPYYVGYNNPQYTNYGAGTYYMPATNQRPVVVVPPEPYRPNVSNSRYEADRVAKMRQPIRPASSQSSSSSSSKPSGYNSNASRKYKTGNSSGTGTWSNPGYHNNSRSNSGSSSGGSRSSGSVSGARRR